MSMIVPGAGARVALTPEEIIKSLAHGDDPDIPIPLTPTWQAFVNAYGDGTPLLQGSRLAVGDQIGIVVNLETLVGLGAGDQRELHRLIDVSEGTPYATIDDETAWANNALVIETATLHLPDAVRASTAFYRPYALRVLAPEGEVEDNLVAGQWAAMGLQGGQTSSNFNSTAKMGRILLRSGGVAGAPPIMHITWGALANDTGSAPGRAQAGNITMAPPDYNAEWSSGEGWRLEAPVRGSEWIPGDATCQFFMPFSPRIGKLATQKATWQVYIWAVTIPGGRIPELASRAAYADAVTEATPPTSEDTEPVPERDAETATGRVGSAPDMPAESWSEWAEESEIADVVNSGDVEKVNDVRVSEETPKPSDEEGSEA